MSNTQTPPAGWTFSHFKAVCADVGSWTWGTVQGAFNEKASFSQILVDAVIGMIPLVGDVTAVRDLIAIIIGLIDDPKKRQETMQWVLLVVLVVALIPVFGGVAKGVGRIVCKVFEEAALLRGAARLAHIAEGAKEIIAFLNRLGVRNAEKWMLALHFADHQAAIIGKFHALLDVINRTLTKISSKVGSMMPAALGRRIEGLRTGLAQLKTLGDKMIPEAIKELDKNLREIQTYIHTGGETTSRAIAHEVATGDRAVTRADEARLVEDGTAPARTARGGWAKNPADPTKPKQIAKYYKHQAGYPDLMSRKSTVDGVEIYPSVAAYSGKMVNRPLKNGESVSRVFGPEGVTHGVSVGESSAGGVWWWLGEEPKTAKEWRPKSAVLDEWNRDGFIIVGKVKGGSGPKAVVGAISEQSGQKLAGQYIPGGAMQAFFILDEAAAKEINALGKKVISSGKAETWVDAASGMEFEIKPTGWKDANGVWGYRHAPRTGSLQTTRLAAREIAAKKNNDVTVTP